LFYRKLDDLDFAPSDKQRYIQMESVLAPLVLAIILFASTNVDDLLVLVAFFADPKFRAREIVVGQYVGVALLFLVSLAASLLAFVIPGPYIGLLGFAPILIGLKQLLKAWRDHDSTGASPQLQDGGGPYGKIVGVALVTIANGGDNIGIYTPSFAVHSGHEIAVIAAVFAGMTAVWCILAHRMVNHQKLGVPIRRYAHGLAPIVLIALGVEIIYHSGSWRLLLRQ
jgi:cadmium resistance protein CadD (predicted permease)